jgi:hypothetical protein
MPVTFVLPDDQINYDYDNDQIKIKNGTKTDYLKFLKGKYATKERFMEEYVPRVSTTELLKKLRDFLVDNFDDAKKFTYEEAFKLEDEQFRIKVFETIDISEMVENLGKTKIKVDGKRVIEKKYTKEGEYIGTEENNNIYETYEVSNEKLGLEGKSYVVKCWCTTTNKEHWLWIEEKYKDDPLAAIASTFRVHENILPHIKELKRQGDILMVELDKEVEPKGEIVPLTKEQYFGWLSAQA